MERRWTTLMAARSRKQQISSKFHGYHVGNQAVAVMELLKIITHASSLVRNLGVRALNAASSTIGI